MRCAGARQEASRRRAEFGNLFKLRQSWPGSRGAMEESMGPQGSPGPIQALLRTSVTVGEAQPLRAQGSPSIPATGRYTHFSTTVEQNEGWHLIGSDIASDND